jgi:archaellum biogenesis ATPase FlaH
MDCVEKNILQALCTNENYTRAVLPHIKKCYFGDRVESVLFDIIKEYFDKYDSLPTVDVISIEIENRNDLSQSELDSIQENYQGIFTKSEQNLNWLLDTTEKWCRDRAIYLALMDAIAIHDGNDKSKTPDSIPSILSEALAVSFDNSVGHDYIEDWTNRYDFYTKKEEKIPFDIDYLNKVTNGGLPKKTLNCWIASTGVGKSLVMCHFASTFIQQGLNVLYITMEMAEEKIAERIDANLMDVSVSDLNKMPKSMFETKFRKVQSKSNGRLIIKQFPTGHAHVGHFRALIQELKTKKAFIPDVIFIDYLNICASSRVKNNNANSYTIVKSIAEELRGLAIECNVPLVTATQTNRSGFQNTDVDLDNTSESFGLPATVDLMMALMSTEELEEAGQIMMKTLKNRYGDPNKYKRFVVGINRDKMRLFDMEQSNKEDSEKVVDISPVSSYTGSSGKLKKAANFSDFKF